MEVFINGLGSCVPARVVSNHDIEQIVGVDATEIENKTGISERRWVEPGTNNSDLAYEATLRALAGAGLQANALDALIVATLSPDAGFPGTGVFLQRLLGLQHVPALDVRNQCSGFLYGLSIARAWLQTGAYKAIGLVGSEVHSTGLDMSPRGGMTTALFGDGAGAAILSTEPSPLRVEDVRLGADGSGVEALWCELPASGLHPNISAEYLEEGRQFPQMKGRVVLRKAVETLQVEITRLLQDHQIVPSDVLFVPHQASELLNRMIVMNMKMDAKKMVSTIEEFGNMTAASLPVTLERAMQHEHFQPGTPIVMAAFGSGFTWGVSLLRVTDHP